MAEALENLGINGPFLIAQVVNFLILFGLLSVLLWKPAKKRLEERQDMLEQQREDAEAAARERERIQEERERVLEKAREEAQEIVTQGRERVQEIKDQASQEADQIIQEARKDAREEEQRILKGMRDKVAPLAMAAAHKLLDSSLDKQRQQELIDEFFSGVEDGQVVVLEGAQISGEQAEIISALPLKDQEKAVISKELQDRVKGELAIDYRVNPEILGGIIIRVGDKEYDHSVAGQLAEMRARLT